MGEVITYASDKRRCYCQLKLDSGERILVSIGRGHDGTTATIKIFRLLLGMIPTSTVWESDNIGREVARLYLHSVEWERLVKEVRSQTDILNLFRDDLIRCKSIAEVRERLS